MKRNAKNSIFRCLALAAAVVMMGTSACPALAASKKKIQSVKISVSGEVIYGTDIGEEELEFKTSTPHCSVEEYEILNEENYWEAGTIPEVEVTLLAADGYYFSVTKASDVKLSGMGAQYISGKKKDNSTMLVVQMKLSDVVNQVGEIRQASWNSADRYEAVWDDVEGASSYIVTLYKDGNRFGSSKTTKETHFDFQEYMNRTGTYTYTIRAVGGKDEKTKSPRYDASGEVYVNKEEAALNSRMYQEIREKDGRAYAYGTGGPGTRAKGWVREGSRWWYSNGDGTYPSDCWWKDEEGNWYHFDQDGYMQTGWWEDEHGSRFYLNPVPDGSCGQMATGVRMIDGIQYEFQENGAVK